MREELEAVIGGALSSHDPMIGPGVRPDGRFWLNPSEAVSDLNADVLHTVAMVRAQTPLMAAYGTARDESISPAINRAVTEICRELSSQLGLALLTGGGSGIMNVTTHAVRDVHETFAVRSELLSHEHVAQNYSGVVNAERFLWTRRFLLTTLPSVVIAAPGGYGTLNEVFELSMLRMADIVGSTPIICIEDNRGYWSELKRFALETIYNSSEEESQKFDQLWTIYNVEQESASALAIRIADELNQRGVSPDDSKQFTNAKWFEADVIRETAEDLKRGLELLEGKNAPALVDKTFLSAFGSVSEHGQHFRELLAKFDRRDWAVLTDDPWIADQAYHQKFASLALVSALDSNFAQMLPGNLTGNFVAPIRHLICANRFVQTSAPAIHFAYPGGITAIDRLLEVTLLQQLGIIRHTPIVCLEDSCAMWSKLHQFIEKHLLGAGYISSGDDSLWHITPI
ncbi:MAG: LOG family protein [Bdellovibrionales bacterium]|nr:LOG family protein [Bdellovibrionales bacterium]